MITASLERIQPNIPTLATIQEFEREMARFPQLEIDVTHHFADGVYGREALIPAGVVFTGKIHAHRHISVICGDITVWTDEGMRRLTGWHVLVSRAGTKRVGLAHADTHWIAIHASEETDLDALEAQLIVPEHNIIGNESIERVES